MKINDPVFGTLIKRYKRFFSEVMLDNGEVVTAHTPNTGPMTTCWEAGMRCVLSKSPNPKRKLAYTLELTSNDKTFIMVNTHRANRLVEESLLKQEIEPLAKYTKIFPEFKIGNSRFDFLVQSSAGLKAIVEVKNASTVDTKGMAIFPDTRSDRALKHVLELTEIQKSGSYQCFLLFLVAREDPISFRPSFEHMPDYLEACRVAKEQGVILLAAQWTVSPEAITFDKLLPVLLD